MQNQYANTKDGHRRRKEGAIPGKDPSPAAPLTETANNLKRSLPEDIDNASSQHKKRQALRLETRQSVHFSTPDKHLPQDGIYGSDAQPPSRGKRKAGHQEQPQGTNSTSPSAPDGDKKPTETTKATPTIPSEVRHLTTKYELIPMSIISSSKMEQKIRNVIERVSKFSFGDVKAKPGVVILHAEAKNVSKMVTIAELAKKSIEKDKGIWWQYTKLEGQVMEMKEKKKKKPSTMQSGRTLATGEVERRTTAEVETHVDIDMDEIRKEPTAGQQPYDVGSAVLPEEDEEQEEAFETMSVPTNASRQPARKKVRAVPVMTIYLARVPIPGLRESYGEQTNSLAP